MIFEAYFSMSLAQQQLGKPLDHGFLQLFDGRCYSLHVPGWHCDAQSQSMKGTHLLHHDCVVALKGDIDVHVVFEGADAVGGQEALAPAALSAGLQRLHTRPRGPSLEA